MKNISRSPINVYTSLTFLLRGFYCRDSMKNRPSCKARDISESTLTKPVGLSVFTSYFTAERKLHHTMYSTRRYYQGWILNEWVKRVWIKLQIYWCPLVWLCQQWTFRVLQVDCVLCFLLLNNQNRFIKTCSYLLDRRHKQGKRLHEMKDTRWVTQDSDLKLNAKI